MSGSAYNLTIPIVGYSKIRTIHMPKIFISYRRDDAQARTEQIHQPLAQAFGRENVFLDVADNIPIGSDWAQVLEDRLTESEVLLVIIGRHWERIINERADQPDFVRMEIEHGLKRNQEGISRMAIIPVLVNKANMPMKMPESIQGLLRYQVTHVRGVPDFNNDMQKLIDDLKRAYPESSPVAQAAPKKQAQKQETKKPITSNAPLMGGGAAVFIVTMIALFLFFSGAFGNSPNDEPNMTEESTLVVDNQAASEAEIAQTSDAETEIAQTSDAQNEIAQTSAAQSQTEMAQLSDSQTEIAQAWNMQTEIAQTSTAQAAVDAQNTADAQTSAQQFDLSDYNFNGEEVEIFGYSGSAIALELVIENFNAITGANVIYVGVDDFEPQLRVRIAAGDSPNIALHPGLRFAQELASYGDTQALPDNFASTLRNNYVAGDSFVDLGTYTGADGSDHLYGIYYDVGLFDLVWYIPDNFEDAGYDIPETWSDIIALSDAIVASGRTPWCMGWESGAASGWHGTNWLESILLRSQPLSVYDGWITNDIAFDDSRIVQAFDILGDIIHSDNYMFGGSDSIATTFFGDAPLGLFSVPPDCYMHMQASFIPAFFPEGISVPDDVSFFVLPPIDNALGRPQRISGSQFVVYNSSPATMAFMEYLLSPDVHAVAVANGLVSPHLGIDLGSADAQSRLMNEIVQGATAFRLDASDNMPGAVGLGAFWTGMIEFSQGRSAQDVAADIQSVWDDIED